MSAIIDFISNFVEITGNPTIDSILFGISGLLAFSVAFGIVGDLFDLIGKYDSDLMSGTHWIIRTIAFVVLTWFFIKIFDFFTWLFSFKWWIYLIVIFIIILIIVTVFILKSKRTNIISNEQLT